MTQGLEIARALQAKVTAVNVTEPRGSLRPGAGKVAMAFPLKEYEESVAANAARVLAAAADEASALGAWSALVSM